MHPNLQLAVLNVVGDNTNNGGKKPACHFEGSAATRNLVHDAISPPII
jgi:hypothetical protein